MSALERRAAMLITAAVVIALGLSLSVVSQAVAAQWWKISAETVPTNLPPGGEGQILISASNLSDHVIDGGEHPITAAIKLPPGLGAVALVGGTLNLTKVECSLGTLRCSFAGAVYPYERLDISIKVKVDKSLPASMPALETRVEGGGAATALRTLRVPISGSPAAFGVAGFELEAVNEDGTPATQAGSHPFQLTTTLVLNQTAEPRNPVELPKDLSFHLPAGLVGNPQAIAQCTMADFFALVKESNLCPPGSVVGVASVAAEEPKYGLITATVPVFNLSPSRGEPARFGFEVAGKIPVVIDTAVRSGGDYGVNVSVKNATETAGLLNSQVTFWGVPGDARHNNARGWECVANGAFAGQVGKSCPAISAEPEAPFLTLPRSCARDPQSEPVVFSLEVDSWAKPGTFLGAEYAWTANEGRLLGYEGCDQLPFAPSISVTPEQHTASTPSGLDVSVRVPQQTTLEMDKLAEADVRDTTVTLPEGVQLSPSAANGLEACSEAEVGFTGFDPTTHTTEFDATPVSCPDGSKLGTVKIKTPLLKHELEGAVYLAQPAPSGEVGKNPFGSLVALYLVAEDPVSGVLVKLAGEGQVDESTLRISTTFRNAPQVPFEELDLHLFGGQRASVTTPPTCGGYATDATFTPWSGTGPVVEQARAADFVIESGVGGASCPTGAPFGPGFTAHSQSVQAGSFTDFWLELSRPDGNQALSGLSMHLPSGIAALLSSVELCSDAEAGASACPVSSEVGHAVAIAGLGSEPYVQEGGRVYITGPYGDAPFGLEIVTPAKAGPFDLGYVTVRSKLYVNENDASVTIVSDPLPTQIRGIPLQLKRVLVTVDRAGFEFNPTSCEPMRIDGTITGSGGASASVSSPFQVGGCANLAFNPQLTASAVGQGSKTEGTTFAVTVRSGGTNASGVAQAGIAKVQLQLPKQLSSRLPTLQKACIDSVFNANPASCDEGSVIGYATIHTPVLKNPLTGPAYLVSHGGAAFPDVEFVLQGENIKLVLDGKTDIKGELTYSRFESTPDAPFTVFETVLPGGPHGVLTPNVAESKRFSLCGEDLVMPTTMIAQNGMRIEQETKVQVTGCGEVRSAKKSRLTLKQQLTRALRSCKHNYSHAKHRRTRCQRQAHARYTRQALAACRHQVRHVKQRKKCERAARAKFGLRGKKAVHRKRSRRS
jgi:hypothetical protein